MKKFIHSILMFSVIIMVIAIIVDIMISKGLKHTERGHFYTMNALMNQRMDADLVILGNSRASWSYNPIIFDSILKINARNLGVSGQPFGVSYLRWRLYRRNNVKPKLLIINIDYMELNMVTNGYEKEQYYPYMHDTLVFPYLGLYGCTWPEIHIPMYRYRGDYKLMGIGLMELLHLYHDTKGDYIKGYSNKNWNWKEEGLEAVLQNGKIKGKCNLDALCLLEALLKEADKDGMQVVFVYAPIYKKLKDNLDEYLSMNAYQKLSKKYEVPILDFSEMDICIDTEFFHDANHVNSIGADRFSLELACSLDSLGLLKR